MFLLFVVAAICADAEKIPDDVLTYLKAEETARDALIDVHQKEIARLKVIFAKGDLRRRKLAAEVTKEVLDEIKRIEALSPFLYRFPGPPPIGAIGCLDDTTVLATFPVDDKVIALVQVKHNKVKPGGKNPLEEDVLSFVLVAGVEAVEDKVTLPRDNYYRAVQVERDTELAESALAKLPRATQAVIGKKSAPPVRHLMLLEEVEADAVNKYRDQFARMRLRK